MGPLKHGSEKISIVVFTGQKWMFRVNPQEMEISISSPKSLPDVAKESSLDLYPPLNWVGMTDISLPLKLMIQGQSENIIARMDAQVSLDLSTARGIHMSRLYAIIQGDLVHRQLSLASLIKVSEDFLHSHQELSSAARLRVRADIPVKRKALKSENEAWRTYPVTWKIENRFGKTRIWLEVEVIYSSTCPASAALSRQLIQENFKAHFSGSELSFNDIHQWLGSTEGILATPHAQRSFANVSVEIQPDQEFDFLNLIDLIEEALQTPVQTMVKREDEQEFAKRNGQNLMFCEDAARRIQSHLLQESMISDYWIRVSHQESLHPHNAVCHLSKVKYSLPASW